MTAELTIVTGIDEFSAERCLEVLQAGLRRFSIPAIGFSLYGEAVDLKQTAKVLKATGRSHFLLEGNGWRFQLSSVGRYAIDKFAIEAAWECLNADEWMNEFAGAFPVRQAWVVDAEYDFWQNAEDPLQYLSQCRPYEHLPKRSNGLPPPLEQTVIDTSNNPGRRNLHVGYVEAVGSPMWLGSKFCELTGTSKNTVLSKAWLHAEVFGKELVRLSPSMQPFCSSDAESSKVQNELRRLLYNSTVDADCV